jgi:hypothetical protein
MKRTIRWKLEGFGVDEGGEVLTVEGNIDSASCLS